MYEKEEELWRKGYSLVAGIDEAGRGPLAGPVVAAVVVLYPFRYIRGIKDSKRLTPAQRERFFQEIVSRSLMWGIGIVEARIIEEINILQATRLAMKRALENLPCPPHYLLIDAVKLRELSLPQESLIKGDETVASIACASIVAKVMRDRIMVKSGHLLPRYGFHLHKGYPTFHHLKVLKDYGPTVLHRKTFSPLKEFKEKRDK